MKKALKIVFVSVVSLLFVVIIAGYIALTQVDFNSYKSLIVKTVKNATGRDLKIGDIKVKPSFSSVIEVKNVELSNANWAKKPNMISIANVELDVDVIPLLKGNFQINNFKISNADINLEENASNGANWVFGGEGIEIKNNEKTSFRLDIIKNANASEVSFKKSDSILSFLIVKEVSLDDVRINYTDKSGKTLAYNVKNLNLSENNDKNIDFNFNVNDGEYKGEGSVGALKLLESMKGYPVKANLSVMGIDVSLDTKLFDVMNNISFDGKAKVLNFLGKDKGFNEKLEVAFKGDLKNIDVAVRELNVAGNVVDGIVKCDLNNVVPLVNVNLNSSKIDIASFNKVEKKAFNLGFIKEAKATEIGADVKIPYKDFYVVNLNSNIKIGKLMNKGGVIGSDIEVRVILNNGDATVNLVKGVIAQGNLGGKIGLSAKSKQLDMNVSATKVNAVNLLKELKANNEAFSFLDGGLTDLYVNLKSSGETGAELIENLDGSSVVVVDKSKVYLGNIGVLKGDVVSQLLHTLNITKGNDELNMNCAVVRADFKDKKAFFPNGIVVNADKFTIVADGNINLSNDGLSISIKPFAGKLTETNIAKALSSLVKLTGTIKNPKIGVDSANAIKTIVGVTTVGPVYLGAQMLLENDGSPCYTALAGTGYENRFPQPKNVVQSTGEDVGKILNDSVGSVKDTTKSLINLLSGGLKAKNEKK